MAQGNLKYQFARLSVAEKLIAINVLVFIVSGLFPFLLNLPKNSIVQWFELPKDFINFLGQPWSIITYSFFHGGFSHLFWNMLILYFFSRTFLNLFDAKRFLNVYFLGVILGGIFFVVSYNIFPAFFNVSAVLIGASAGVRAILIFICAYIPNQDIRLVFFNVKLWYIGVGVVVLDLLQMPYGGNAGGHIAHLGGALLGYIYARQLLNGKDIGSGFAKIMDAFIDIFKRKEKKAPLKTVHRNKKTTNKKTKSDTKDVNQRKIDSILDKISKSGYESLTKEEKDFLFKAGKE